MSSYFFKKTIYISLRFDTVIKDWTGIKNDHIRVSWENVTK